MDGYVYAVFSVMSCCFVCSAQEPQMVYVDTCVYTSLLTNKRLTFLSSGLVQGMITGIRGLCNGLGPALYGLIFFMFNVELNTIDPIQGEYPIDPIPINPPAEVNGLLKPISHSHSASRARQTSCIHLSSLALKHIYF